MSAGGLRSGLAPLIEEFLAQKRASGHPYANGERVLRRFDGMVADEFPGREAVDRDMCEAWVSRVAGSPGVTTTLSPVRQLTKYLAGSDRCAYVIPDDAAPRPAGRYEPHIFTAAELVAFFAAADALRPLSSHPTRHYVVPTFFRVLYCCGLRSSEARLLPREAVDLSDGRVAVGPSKGWLGRTVYLGADLLAVCRRYDELVGRVAPGREAFFPTRSGGFWGKGAPDRWFHAIWDGLPVAASCAGNQPRVHDFRHTHTVALLDGWAREGVDCEAMYAHLSGHLGHAGFASTDWYLRLAPPFYGELDGRMRRSNAEVLPEVVRHGEE